MSPTRSVIRNLAVLVLLSGAGSVAAEPFQTIRNNGSPNNRVDIAILGDGYTAAELTKYRNDVQAFMDGLFAQEPYKEYQRYYNVHRIDVTSAQSGSDHPEAVPAVFVNTALHTTYDCFGIDRLICADNGAVATVVSNTLTAAQSDVVLVIVNDATYGGSGGSIAVASTHTDAVELILHELGHSFASLADEYGGPPPPECSPGFEPFEANAAFNISRAQIKWASWISASTPLPTTTTTPGVPGAYEGARYCDAGLYRPTFESKMRLLGFPFEAINVEQHIRQIYNFVSPLDSGTPASGEVSIPSTQSQTFTVTTPSPFTHALGVTWLVDNVNRGTGSSFVFNASAFAQGQHTVDAVIRDATAMVRNDPNQLLVETRRWLVTVTSGAVPTVTLTATDANASEPGTDTGSFRVTRTGATTSTLTVQVTVSGTATSGTDYTAIGTTVSIPAGAASATVTVNPSDDTAVEPAESVVLSLVANAAYTVGSPASATVMIADNDSAIPNVALNKPTLSSSNEAGRASSLAVDGNASTRWASTFSDPQWIRVDLGSTHSISRVVLRWEAAFGRSYQIQVSNDGNSWTNIFSTTTGDGSVDDLTGLSGSGRYVRMNGTVRGTEWGYSLWELEVYGTPVTVTPTPTPTPTRTPTPTPTPVAGNRALNRPTLSSSNESASTAASFAVDGNAASTRWASARTDPQWMRVDLGATVSINRVVLRWEAAFGRAYQIQVSNDGNTWTPIFNTTTGDGGVDDLTGLSGSGRFVRMNGTARGNTSWGYSLWELEVYGN